MTSEQLQQIRPTHDGEEHRMHQSTVALTDVCARRLYYRYIDPQPRRLSVSQLIGTAYHAGLAQGYTSLQNGDPIDMKQVQKAAAIVFRAELEEFDPKRVDWTFQAATKRKDRVDLTPAQAMKTVSGMLERYNTGDHWWPQERYEVVAVEDYFVLPMIEGPEGWEVAGTADLVLRDKQTGWYVVVDHKTSKQKWRSDKHLPEKSPQAAFYVDAYRRKLDTERVTFGYDIQGILDGSFERRQAHRTDVHIDLMRKKAAMVAQLIDQGGPFIPNPTSFLCHENYCDYWDVCPFGRLMHETDNN